MKLGKKEVIALIVVGGVLLCCGLIIGWHFGYEGINPIQNQNKALTLSDLDNVYNLIHDDYYEATNTPVLIADAISSMVDDLNDGNSFYLPPDEYQKYQAWQNGKLFDIGIEFVTQNKQGLILEVYPGTPAASAGLQPGDVITKINGVDTEDLPGVLPITDALVGNTGTGISLTVLKANGSVQNLNLVREAYKIPTVNFEMISTSTGYLKIYSFDPPLLTDFAPIEQTIENDHPTNLIIDLRNNPGGSVDTVLPMINKFVNSGVLFSEQIGQSNAIIVHKAAGNAEFGNLHIVLIVNDFTASAAEIFTAALKENNRAIVVGTTTQGKATEESFVELSDGSAVRLIVARWFAPDGEWTNGKGITPDIVVSQNNNNGVDIPLETAIQHFAQ